MEAGRETNSRKNCISFHRLLNILISEVMKKMRTVAELVSEGFIWAVGITRPKPGREHLAALYITLLLVGIVMMAACVLFFLLGRI